MARSVPTRPFRAGAVGLATLAAATLYPFAGQAQSVNDCDWVASARNLVEPWGDYTRTFSNGEVRIALLDTVEPAAGALHSLVLSPPRSELGDRQCRVISYAPGIGFPGLDFGQLDASYDPATGLTFTVPGSIFENDVQVPRIIVFTLNQATGEILTGLR
ncbi:hypothetical protein ACKTEK_00550 [Tepidamorphus sp. 3E244]|uniref:hypothetical protein n=1 Tax=Tepidamorphus sp. 3E244 TaxID=3385498 RepID=UPI0038FC97B4